MIISMASGLHITVAYHRSQGCVIISMASGLHITTTTRN